MGLGTVEIGFAWRVLGMDQATYEVVESLHVTEDEARADAAYLEDIGLYVEVSKI